MRDFVSTVDYISNGLSRIKSQAYYRFVLRAFGRKSTIRRPMAIRGGKWTSIGSNTFIRDGARIEVIHRLGEPEPSLTIGDRVLIEQGVHLICSSRVTIENDVAIAARCAIVDTTHPMPWEVDDNVGYHLLPGPAEVHIGQGTMLGVGVVVLANVKIGRHCMIGANSVVTDDVPEGSVVAGVPARVIRTTHREKA